MNEKTMMKEIRSRGPLAVGIIVPYYLSYYKSGVIGCDDTLLPEEMYTENQLESLRRIRDDFRLVEHMVAMVGWGVEPNGQKYWIIQNSYFFIFSKRIKKGGEQAHMTMDFSN